ATAAAAARRRRNCGRRPARTAPAAHRNRDAAARREWRGLHHLRWAAGSLADQATAVARLAGALRLFVAVLARRSPHRDCIGGRWTGPTVGCEIGSHPVGSWLGSCLGPRLVAFFSTRHPANPAAKRAMYPAAKRPERCRA